MPFEWNKFDTIVREQCKPELQRLYKCLNKTELPVNYKETLTEFRDRFNEFSKLLEKAFGSNLTAEHRVIVEEHFFSARDHLARLRIRHIRRSRSNDDPWNFIIPNHIGDTLDLTSRANLTDTEDTEEEQDIPKTTQASTYSNPPHSSQDEGHDERMPVSAADVLNQAAKVLFPFNGDPGCLQSFVDALTLVDSMKDTHENVAINVIKTFLRGSARAAITNENTIEDIIQKLTSSIKIETVAEATNKLNAADPRNRNAEEYAKAVEELSSKLKMAYISEKVPVDVAERMAADAAIRSILSKSTNREVNTVLQAAPLQTVSSVTAKYLQIKASQTEHQIMSIRYKGHRGRGNHSRGRGNHSRGRNYYHDNRGRNYYHDNRGHRGNRGNHGQNRGNRGHRNYQTARPIGNNSENQGNGQSPHGSGEVE